MWDFHREASPRPEGSNCFSSWILTSISKETYFPEGFGPCAPHSGSAQVYVFFCRLLFYAERGQPYPHIGRAYMDGSSVTDIVTQDILRPKAIVIDYNSRLTAYKSASTGQKNLTSGFRPGHTRTSLFSYRN